MGYCRSVLPLQDVLGAPQQPKNTSATTLDNCNRSTSHSSSTSRTCGTLPVPLAARCSHHTTTHGYMTRSYTTQTRNNATILTREQCDNAFRRISDTDRLALLAESLSTVPVRSRLHSVLTNKIPPGSIHERFRHEIFM
jgi:hypothetical protein